MEFQLDHEWRMRPIKGDTGKAYVGFKADSKVFIKRNTTPMLAALSKEGITPKLIWTKRTGNGDTLTAQEWLDGHSLSPDEIGKRNDVSDVLYQLHHSESLKRMLAMIGGEVVSPKSMLKKYQQDLAPAIADSQFLSLVENYLKKNIPAFDEAKVSVVHGDVNYRNWLVCHNYLYLVDWDAIMFADAAVDLGTFLGHYVPMSSWNSWLLSYGMRPDPDTIEKVYWYALISLLNEVKKYFKRGESKAMNQEILQLKRVFSS